MSDPTVLVVLSSAGTLALAAATGSALSGWQSWLELKRLEAGKRSQPVGLGRNGTALAELRARVRRLEAIADGGPRHSQPSV